MSSTTPALLPHHAALIRDSAIAPAVTEARDYRPLSLKTDLAHLKTFVESRGPRFATEGERETDDRDGWQQSRTGGAQ